MEGSRYVRKKIKMPRTLSAAMISAIAASQLTLAIFAQIAFADATYYLFTGIGSLTPAGPPSNPASTFPYGQTFLGMGWLGKISAIPQTTKIQAQNITLSLSGVPSALIGEAIGQVRITGTATLWLGLFDTNNNLLQDPVQIFAGSLDVPTVDDSGQTCNISITCENPLLRLNLAPNRLFDDADQQIYYPGDLGFSFVDRLTNMALFWPAPNALSTPYPLYMTVVPASADIAVGGTTTVAVTMHYSDGSTNTLSGLTRSGSGPFFTVALASSNPKVATFSYTTGLISGLAPGTCSIIARCLPPGSVSSSGAAQSDRAAGALIVHS